MSIPDVYDLWEDHEREKEKLLEQLPNCEICGKIIQDDFYYEINDAIICEECLIDNHRKRTEDFIS
jgi:hypothetical protein